MKRRGRTSIVITAGAALALLLTSVTVAPAPAATTAVVSGTSARAVTAGVGSAATMAFAVPTRKRTKATKIMGWKAARKARYPSVALSRIRVTGPVDRPVKVQKRKKSGGWKTVTTVRTSEAKGVDVSFIARQPGSWRLKVRAVSGYRSRTTSTLRVTKKSWKDPGPGPQANPTTPGTIEGVGAAGAVGARLPVSYDLGGVAGSKLFVSVSGSDSAAGTQSAPLRTVAAAVAKVPSGGSATVVVRGGTYREGQLTVPAGRAVRLRAFPGEIPTFVGSQSLSSGWVTEGSLRYHSYTPQPVTDASGMSFSGGQGLTGDGAGKYPDQAWVGSHQLRQVASKSSVVAGTFWVDQSNKRIYLYGTDAAKGGVEVSSLDVFLTIQGADSLVEGLRVSRFSNSADDYGVVKLLGAADRTVVRDVEITEAAFQALMLAGEESTSGILEGVVLENLTISRANWMGISSNMVGNLTMRRLWISGLNQFKEFTNAPQSGAFKASRNRNVKFVDGVVENNNGHGVWFDQSSYDAEVAGNRITGNSGSSVFFEISDGLVLANNYINSTGERAVKLAGASGLVLVNNTILGSSETLGVYVDTRSQPGCSAPSQPVCPGSTSSDRDVVRPWLPRLDWMPRIDLMINNIIAYPTASGYCAGPTVCISGSNGSATAPVSTVIHQADPSRGIPQTVIDGNVYANGSGAAVATEVGSFSTHSDFGTAMASSPVSIGGIEARGKTGNGWVNADGSATAELAARHGEAVTVPSDARINQYVPAGTRAYGYLR